jgi:hypothetical protein
MRDTFVKEMIVSPDQLDDCSSESKSIAQMLLGKIPDDERQSVLENIALDPGQLGEYFHTGNGHALHQCLLTELCNSMSVAELNSEVEFEVRVDIHGDRSLDVFEIRFEDLVITNLVSWDRQQQLADVVEVPVQSRFEYEAIHYG